MNYTDFVISCGRSNIVFPVFTDPDEAAARMNRFYSKAAGIIHACGEEYTREKFAAFSCCFCVEETDVTVSVSLNFTCTRRGERRERKTVTHIWKYGYIWRKEVV